MSWVEEHTKNNENNIAKLLDFLKGNYETYSSRIDSILSTLENISFDDDKCIFDKIISEFNKKLKSDVSAFVNKPDEFENNIDGFLTDLEDEFVGLDVYKRQLFLRMIALSSIMSICLSLLRSGKRKQSSF